MTISRSLSILALTASLISIQARAGSTGTNIIGGQDVQTSDAIARRTVALILVGVENGKEGMGICSGSIIDNSHILTAAHCVRGFKYGYVAFTLKNAVQTVQKAAKSATAGNVVRIVSAKTMPGYGGQIGGSAEFPDFAIVTYSGGIPAGYEPAHFLSNSVLLSQLKQGTPITLAGYGITSAPSTGLEDQDGLQGAGTLRKVNVSFYSLTAKKQNMWLQGQTNHIACEGDSGGPALYRASGETYVVGVDSRGDCHSVAIYSTVSAEMVQSFLKI